VVGRMNINSILTNSNPFASQIDRTLPLTALLTNNLLLTVPNYIEATAVTNAYFYSYGAFPGPGYAIAPVSPFSPYSYTMIGEVANTTGLGLPSTAVPGAKNDRETPVRGIANIITTRSDTFTVWAIAQAFSGVNSRPAEVKVEAIVQRSVDYTATPPGVSFRTLYYRYIYN
jgi:hypothetical protein